MIKLFERYSLLNKTRNLYKEINLHLYLYLSMIEFLHSIRFWLGCSHLNVMKCILSNQTHNTGKTVRFGISLSLKTSKVHQIRSNSARHFDFMNLRMNSFYSRYFYKTNNRYFCFIVYCSPIIQHIELYQPFELILLFPSCNSHMFLF